MPSTLRLRAEAPADLARASAILRGGGLVAFPTETVYGLGASALSAEAVAGIFRAKGRPSWDPLIVHLAEISQLDRVATLPTARLRQRVERIAEDLWPGPLTVLLPRTDAVPDAVTAGRPLMGVRLPAHAVAQQLLRMTGVPIAAPSANRFGHISPTTAAHVLDDLDGRIDAVLDGGACSVGLESTVLDPAPTPMVLYRAGAVTAAELERITGEATAVYQPEGTGKATTPQALPSPGVGIRHYAPGVPLQLCGPTPEELQQELDRQLQTRQGRVGALLPEGWPLSPNVRLVALAWGDWQRPETLAHQLFGGLRALEAADVSTILCPLPEPGGLRDALRDRLLKAARPA